ncbi:MAG: hypothetical protein ACRDJC_07775 [Thermomicrobiales bacterium]
MATTVAGEDDRAGTDALTAAAGGTVDDVASATRRWERKIDTAVVVILAIASLLAAWGGYQAGLWSGKKSTFVTAAEAKQIEATRATTIGYQLMQIDIAMELNWLRASRENNSDLAEFYESRFSPHLTRAFAAWLATDPLENPDAPKDPFGLPEYQIPELQAAAELDEEARLAFAEAERAGATGDAYVLATLLLAVVLFFAGVSTKIGWRPAQLALLGLAVLLLLYAVQNLAVLPDGSLWGITPLRM